MRLLVFFLAGTLYGEELLQVKRICVEKLNGGDTAGHMRDMIITAIQATKLFQLTENPDRADAILRGSAEDLIFTDTFQTSEGITARTNIGAGGNRGSILGRGIGAQVGDNEAQRIVERKHEATASVRLVSPEGDVIWSTTQESFGGKFKGAAADVAEKVAKRLVDDYQKAKGAPAPASAEK
jgi:hypothetical protein